MSKNGAREFEYRDGKSAKFWSITVDGLRITTRWSRIGTAGQTKEKNLKAGSDVPKEVRKLVAA